MLRVIENLAKSLKIAQGHSRSLRVTRDRSGSLKIAQGHSKSLRVTQDRSGSLEMTLQLRRACVSPYYYFIVISYRACLRYSEILVENCDFFIPLAFDAPVRGGPRRNIANVWCEKLEWRACNGKKSFYNILAVSTEYRRVTDGQTDREKSFHSIVHTMHSTDVKRRRRLLSSTYFDRSTLFTTLHYSCVALRFGVTVYRYKWTLTFGVINIVDG